MPRLRWSAVYPRVYGGTHWCGHHRRLPPGLSPRVRGNPTHTEPQLVDAGSIPACTGEPALSHRRVIAQLVYPRVYGGTISMSRAMEGASGLSPRVRGNHEAFIADLERCRSIPACTGEPTLVDTHLYYPWVYPRVYGGTLYTFDYAGNHQGLSPRVRGNQLFRTPPAYWRGSIPACTGEPKNSCVISF